MSHEEGTFFLIQQMSLIRDEGNGNIGAAAHANLRQTQQQNYMYHFIWIRYDESLKKWKQVDQC